MMDGMNEQSTTVPSQTPQPEQAVQSVVPSEEIQVQEPSGVAPGPVVAALRQWGYELPDTATAEDVKELLDETYRQNETVSRVLGDAVDERRLQELLEAEQRYRQLAPQLSEYEKWRQSQQETQAASQQAATNRRFTTVARPDEMDWNLVEYDPKAGAYRPKQPEWQSSADRVNALESQRKEVGIFLASDPHGFGAEITKPLLEPLQKELESLKQQLQQYQQQARRHQSLEMIYNQNYDLFQQKEAVAAFNEEYERQLKNGVPDEAAQETALRFAKLTVAIPTQSRPAQQSSRRTLKRLASVPATHNVPQENGALRSHRPQYDERLSGKARMRQIIAEKMHEAGLPYDDEE